MKQILWYIISFCVSTACFGQNLKDGNGLKVGMWVERKTIHDGLKIDSGIYRAISLDSFNIVEILGTGFYRVEFKNSHPALYTDGIKNNKVSVKDGIWSTFNRQRGLLRETVWAVGVIQKDKYYDSSGALSKVIEYNFEKNTIHTLIYKDSILFKESFVHAEDPSLRSVSYYPNIDLIISNAELKFQKDFLSDTLVSETIFVSSKVIVQIDSILFPAESISISGLSFPLVLNPGVALPIQIVYSPAAKTYRPNDTILLKTSKGNFPIYCDSKASHITYKNFREIDEIDLSRTDDGFLIIPSLGTVTGAYLSVGERTIESFDIVSWVKIDLASYRAGTYNLKIESCNGSADMKLNLRD